MKEKSAIRAFEILEHFREVKRPLRLKQLVDRFGYPTSSTASLLKSMVELGYLSFDRMARSYMPTRRVAMLGDWVLGTIFEDRRVVEAMQNLQDLTGELVMLGVREDLYVRYIEVLRSTLPLQYYLTAGTRRLLVRYGMGWALLSAERDELIERIYRKSVADGEIAADRFPIAAMWERIAEMRREGYIFSRQAAQQPGVGVIAMLVPTAPHQRRLAIGVSGINDRLEANRDTILAAMRAELATLTPG